MSVVILENNKHFKTVRLKQVYVLAKNHQNWGEAAWIWKTPRSVNQVWGRFKTQMWIGTYDLKVIVWATDLKIRAWWIYDKTRLKQVNPSQSYRSKRLEAAFSSAPQISSGFNTLSKSNVFSLILYCSNQGFSHQFGNFKKDLRPTTGVYLSLTFPLHLYLLKEKTSQQTFP